MVLFLWIMSNTKIKKLEFAGGWLEVFHLLLERICLCLPTAVFWQFLVPVLCSVLAVQETAMTAFELSLLMYSRGWKQTINLTLCP